MVVEIDVVYHRHLFTGRPQYQKTIRGEEEIGFKALEQRFYRELKPDVIQDRVTGLGREHHGCYIF